MSHASHQHRERLSRLPVLLCADYTTTDLGGGLTNTNLLVDLVHAPSGLAPGKYVARCSNGGEDMLGIDRESERFNSTAAAQSGVGAPVAAFSAELGILMVGFVEGLTLTNEALAKSGSGPVLERMAAAMRGLHAGPAFAGEFNMFTRQAGYLETVTTRGFPVPAAYTSYASPWAQVQTVLAPRRTALVPCNNDLLAGNFIDTGERIWLIDYEYSGMNDPTFELGNTITECDLNPAQAIALVASYCQRDREQDHAAANLQALCSEYGWSLWGFIQAATSPIDFDFYGWGTERFEKAAARFDSEDFTTLIGALS